MWSFDKNRAARFLHCLRTFDRNVAGSSEVAEIVNWAEDHEQSLQWIFTGNIDEMITRRANVKRECWKASEALGRQSLAARSITSQEHRYNL
jgi:hypothetical protein